MESIDTKKKPLVSVIVPTYNGAKLIQKTLESILCQTYKNIEVIVVDDGSTDGTLEILSKIKDNRLNVFTIKNSGSPARPRNKAIKESKGDFIAFCDQDDLWKPEKLEIILNKYFESPDRDEIGIIFSSAELIDVYGKVVGNNLLPCDFFMNSKNAHKSLLKTNNITACSAIVPKKVLDEVGLLDENLVGVDDYDLWLRITEKFGILAVSKVLCSWRQTRNALSKNKLKQYLETEKIFEKLFDRTLEVREGHGSNIVRIILAALEEKDYNVVKKYLVDLKKYPVSLKAKSLIILVTFNFSLGHYLVLILKKFGIVSL